MIRLAHHMSTQREWRLSTTAASITCTLSGTRPTQWRLPSPSSLFRRIPSVGLMCQQAPATAHSEWTIQFRGRRARDAASLLEGRQLTEDFEPLAGTFCATAHAAAPKIHEMKNPVHASRVLGVLRIAPPQTSNVYSAICPASAHAATRGSTLNKTPSPLAICPAPVRYAQATRYGSQCGTKPAVMST